MTYSRTLGIGAVVCSLIVACSSGTTSTGAGAGGADAQSFIQDLCGTIAPCCAMINKPTDGASCRALYQAFTGSSTYDATSGNACLSQLHAAQGNADFCSTFTKKGRSCKAAFKEGGSSGGTKQPGETCTADGDCASSPDGDVSCYTTFTNNAETKACQVSAKGKENDSPCTETIDGDDTSFVGSGSSDGKVLPKVFTCNVADGLYCQSASFTSSGSGTTSTPSKCQKIQPAGGTCIGSTDKGCAKGTYCDFTMKKCTPQLAVGADCAKATTGCAASTYCATDTHKCTMQLADGSPCTASPQCLSDRCINTKCDSGSSDATVSLQFYCGGN